MLIVLEKIAFLILLIGAGGLARRIGLVTDQTEKDLSKLLVDLFWPALIFYSITGNFPAGQIRHSAVLPLFAGLFCLAGFGVTWLIARSMKMERSAATIFLYNGTINNFVFMVLPFVRLFFGEEGAGLLFIHNLGAIFIMWTLGVSIFQAKFDLRAALRGLLTPGLLATAAGLVCVLSGVNEYFPDFLKTALRTIGEPTIAVAMIIAGSRIAAIGVSALKFNAWNIITGLVRLILLPIFFLGLGIVLKYHFDIPSEIMVIFLLVCPMPVSVNSISLSIRYEADSNLAAQAVVFTHLFSILTVPLYIYLIKSIFLF